MVLLTVLGCSSTAPRASLSGEISALQIHERINANLQRIQTVSGSGSISVESTEMAGSGSFEIALRKPDSVMLKFEGPFGVEVGSALVTRKEFSFYNSIQNQVISGTTSPANMSRYLRMSVTFDDLLNLFAGSAFFLDDTGEPTEFSTDDNQYLLVYSQATRTRKYWVDPTTLSISKIQHLDSRGILVAEQRYSNFRSVGDALLPFTISLTMNAERRILSIRYSAIKVNTEALSFTLNIPESAQRIRAR